MSPLRGRTVVLTRSARDSAPLAERLASEGARVLSLPTLRFVAAEDLRAWEEALSRRREVTHLVFTSARAVDFFLELSARDGIAAESWKTRAIAAVGKRTAARLEEAGLPPSLVPATSTGIGLATELIERGGVGPASVVLLPQSAIARPDLADHLEAAGANVLGAEIYETRAEDPAKAAPLLDALDRGETVDAVVFASPSALDGLLEMTGTAGHRLLAGTKIVSIGPTTSRAVREAGFSVAAEAEQAGVDGLLAAVAAAFATET